MAHTFEKQLEAVITEYESARSQSQQADVSDLIDNIRVRELQTRCLAAIERIVGRNAVYFERATAIAETADHAWGHLAGQVGVAKSLLSDVQNGYLKSVEEIIHSDIFGDFLEMTEHLTTNGYKDAAAVLAGSTLEAHLRQLCLKHGLAPTSDDKPKKAETMNTELAKSGAYSKLDQKNITARLGLRNHAAHGNYSAYDKNQVTLLISSVRDFITRHPA